MLRCIVAGVALLGVLSEPAVAQDTLSDAAWKADIARRAAVRHRAEVQRDSAATRVDTIQVFPAAIILHVGDTLTFPQLVMRLKVVGKSRDGVVITDFRSSYMIPPGGRAIVVNDGQVIAAAVGEGELWTKAHRPTGPFDDARPTTRIRHIVQ